MAVPCCAVVEGIVVLLECSLVKLCVILSSVVQCIVNCSSVQSCKVPYSVVKCSLVMLSYRTWLDIAGNIARKLLNQQ